jgi:hypothetical protein
MPGVRRKAWQRPMPGVRRKAWQRPMPGVRRKAWQRPMAALTATGFVSEKDLHIDADIPL